MPYKKLVAMKYFSPLRIKQMWDDCRIEAAHYSLIKGGKTIIQDGKVKTPLDCIKRYAKIRGLLWALGYDLKKGRRKRTTPEFREMFKLAFPSIRYYYEKYKGKVARRRP